MTEAQPTTNASVAKPAHLGATVLVSQPQRRDVPGIVTMVHADGTVEAQIFNGDHMVHTAHGLKYGVSPGWRWPES